MELLGGFCVSSKHKVSKAEKGERNEAQWSATIVVGEQAKKKDSLAFLLSRHSGPSPTTYYIV